MNSASQWLTKLLAVKMWTIAPLCHVSLVFKSHGTTRQSYPTVKKSWSSLPGMTTSRLATSLSSTKWSNRPWSQQSLDKKSPNRPRSGNFNKAFRALNFPIWHKTQCLTPRARWMKCTTWALKEITSTSTRGKPLWCLSSTQRKEL